MSSRDRMEHTLLRIEKHMHEVLSVLELQYVLLSQRIPPRPVVTCLSLQVGEPVERMDSVQGNRPLPIDAKVGTGQSGGAGPTQVIRPASFEGSEFGAVGVPPALKRLGALLASSPGRRQLGQYLGFHPLGDEHPEARKVGHALSHVLKHCRATSPPHLAEMPEARSLLDEMLEKLGFGR